MRRRHACSESRNNDPTCHPREGGILAWIQSAAFGVKRTSAGNEEPPMIALQNWVHEAREHWKEFQPQRYRALIESRQREVAVRAAAERMFRELMEPKRPSGGGRPMTLERWRAMKLERKMRQANSELRDAIQRAHDAPRVNILSAAPLVEQVRLSAGEMRVLIIGGAIFAMLILAIVAFLVCRI
jgi:hypothetical protein